MTPTQPTGQTRPATTPTGIPVEDCGTCGHRHPITRRHCPTCGLAHAFSCPQAAVDA